MTIGLIGAIDVDSVAMGDGGKEAKSDWSLSILCWISHWMARRSTGGDRYGAGNKCCHHPLGLVLLLMLFVVKVAHSDEEEL